MRKFKYKIILLAKYVINYILKKFDLKLTKNSIYLKLLKNNKDYDFKFLNLLTNNKNKLLKTVKLLPQSQSELRQDLFVLNQKNFKKKGFFVEFGVGNGIEISNTYLLEKKFNWKGILAEPAKIFFKEIEKNRNCQLIKKCVWKNSEKKILFNETLIAEQSTINGFGEDNERYYRNNKKQYEVATISLNDLLKENHAPKIIDYLSIDTEGSEFEILNNFNFNNYKFRIITIEHNYNNNRNKIYKLLIKNGYSIKYKNLTEFEDWYINNSI
jgi:FkbM family methyltransferase